MEWQWWMFLGPSILVAGVIVLCLIAVYGWHLVKLKRAGRLWQDEIVPFLIAIIFFLLSPLIAVIALGALIYWFVTMFNENECGDCAY
ncbi:MAG: hypothetical protein V1704_00655 [Candidatus Vogelbacteria bacterium]